MFFAVKHPASFTSCRLSSFCLRLQLVIYSHQVFACVRFAYCVWRNIRKKRVRGWKLRRKLVLRKRRRKFPMKDGEKLLPKPHKRVAHKPRYNNRYIEFVEALSLPTYCAQRWPPGCGWKYLHQTCKAENSDIELQACDGNLFAWIIVYINSPSTYPSDHISACSCSYGSMGLTVEAIAVFFFFEEFFLPGISREKSEKFWLVIELQSRT